MEAHYATIWESVADAVPDAPALVQGDSRRTWSEFEARAARLAGALAAAGVGPGSKVGIFLYNSPEYLEVQFAALKLRAVPINVNYRYVADELAYLLDNADAEALVLHASLGHRVVDVLPRLTGLRAVLEVDDGGPHLDAADRYEDVLAAATPAPRIERSPDDVTMTYTGGTTGMPKGVVGRIGPAVQGLLQSVPTLFGRSPAGSPDEVAGIARSVVDDGQQYVSLPACPLMHATAMGIGSLPPLLFGSCVVLLNGRSFDVDELWATVERERVNGITIVGDPFARPMLRALEDGPTRQLDSVQFVLSSGAMFSVDVKARLLEHLTGALILDFIASTEGAMGLSVSSRGAVAPTGSFRPGPGVVVLADDGKVIPAGSDDEGVLAIAGAGADAYYKDPEKSAGTFRVVDGVRYTVPGDHARINADGSIELLGRGSQCINTGGEKVFPEEVEEAIKAVPGIDDCLVFGEADERFGQRVVGVASRTAGAHVGVADVLALAQGHVATYKLPRQLLLVDAVPRTATGKADYPAARRLFEVEAAVPD
jgi:fatty-acyl-CoA synthase